ncbi:hypothetical protein BC830DRAFT_717448 [Chytriomyces sp. MP71]|nr:hypothetical protein BC830DRAFT_717448 [Chytriomyces sp. MP71]
MNPATAAAAPAAEDFRNPRYLSRTSSDSTLFGSTPVRVPKPRVLEIPVNKKYKSIPAKTISKQDLSITSERPTSRRISDGDRILLTSDNRSAPKPSRTQSAKSNASTTSALETPLPEYSILPETKAESQSRVLTNRTAARAESETARLLSATALEQEQTRAEVVTRQLQEMQHYMAARLKTDGIFADGGVVGGVDRLVEAERRRKLEAAEEEVRQKIEEEEAARQGKEKEERMKRTGKGRRSLAVAAGGTGDVPINFMTSRVDFRPIPDTIGGEVLDSKYPTRLASIVATKSDHADALQFVEEDEDSILDNLARKLETMKLHIHQTAVKLSKPAPGPSIAPSAPITTRMKGSTQSAYQIHERKRLDRPASKFVRIDSEDVLQRGMSAALVRRASGRSIPRVPLEVAALWKAKDEGRLEADPRRNSPPEPSSLKTEPLQAETKTYRHYKEDTFVSFGDSATILGIRDVLALQNAKVQQLAEEVLGSFDKATPVTAATKHAIIAPPAERNIFQHCTSPSQPLLPEFLDSQTINESDGATSTELRKCQAPPEPVITQFPFASARILDARNRRLVNNSKHDNQAQLTIFQPKMPTNPESLKIQASIHNISQPPSISLSTLAGTSKTAEVCLKNQFKMAPTLSVERGPTKPNPVVELPVRNVLGRLEDVFGITEVLVDKNVTESVLEKMGVKAMYVKTLKK